GITRRVEAGECRNKGCGLGHARCRRAAQIVGGGEGWVESAWAEEVHKRGVHVGERCWPRGIAAHGKRTRGGSLSRKNRVVIRRFEVGGQQIAAHRVGIDGAIDVASAVEV